MRHTRLLPLALAAAVALMVLVSWKGQEGYTASAEECAKRKAGKKFYDETRGNGGKCMHEWNSTKTRRNCDGKIENGKCVVTNPKTPRKCKEGFKWNPYKQTCIRPAAKSTITEAWGTVRKTSADDNSDAQPSTTETKTKKNKKKKTKKGTTDEETENTDTGGKKGSKDLPAESNADERCRTNMFDDDSDQPRCFALLYKCDTKKNAKISLPANVPKGNWSKVCVARQGVKGCDFKKLGDVRTWKSDKKGQGCPNSGGDFTKAHYYQGKRQVYGTHGNAN